MYSNKSKTLVFIQHMGDDMELLFNNIIILIQYIGSNDKANYSTVKRSLEDLVGLFNSVNLNKLNESLISFEKSIMKLQLSINGHEQYWSTLGKNWLSKIQN